MCKQYSSKLRHILRNHKVNLGSIKEVIDRDAIGIQYCKTGDKDADIFSKALAHMKWDNDLD